MLAAILKSGYIDIIIYENCWSIENMKHEKNEKILRIEDLKLMLGVSNSTIWRWRKSGNFPTHIKLGDRLIGFKESDINEWLDSQK